MATLDVDNGKSIYYEHYSGAGTPILLVHGWGMQARIWDLNVSVLLEAGHEVVVFDQRACGKSDKDFDDVGVTSNAADVAKLVEATGLDRPVVAGWSFGAAIAAEAVSQIGDKVRGLVLVGPPTPRFTQTEGFPHGGTAEDVAQTLVLLRDSRPDFLWALTQGVCHAEISQELLRWQWNMFMETSPRADAGLHDLGKVDHREVLPTIDVPTLVMFGAHDAIVDPGVARAAVELLPQARAVEFENSGHAPFLEEREKFNNELLAFLREL